LAAAMPWVALTARKNRYLDHRARSVRLLP
jgi:hypothetical protein